MPPSCYLCLNDFAPIDDYTKHLRNYHVFIPPCNLRCNFGGCIKPFNDYSALRRHIRKLHGNELLTVHADNSNVDFNPVFENDKSYSITEEENDHTNVPE